MLLTFLKVVGLQNTTFPSDENIFSIILVEMEWGINGSVNYAINALGFCSLSGRLTAGYREDSNPRDSDLDFSNHSEI